uniref:Uncharacterized protein n=1 Tax=Cucumis melo TaxID=3656 RepID=A0A9I9DPU2_CUCME
MVSERGKDKTLDTIIYETQQETDKTSTAQLHHGCKTLDTIIYETQQETDKTSTAQLHHGCAITTAAMKKLLHQLQNTPTITTGPPSESATQPSGGNQPHAS